MGSIQKHHITMAFGFGKGTESSSSALGSSADIRDRLKKQVQQEIQTSQATALISVRSPIC